MGDSSSSTAKEEQESKVVDYSPCYALHEFIRAFLKCFGLQQSTTQEEVVVVEEEEEEETQNSEEKDKTTSNEETTTTKDLPSSESEPEMKTSGDVVAIASTRALRFSFRVRPPPRPPINSGGNPQNN